MIGKHRCCFVLVYLVAVEMENEIDYFRNASEMSHCIWCLWLSASLSLSLALALTGSHCATANTLEKNIIVTLRTRVNASPRLEEARLRQSQGKIGTRYARFIACGSGRELRSGWNLMTQKQRNDIFGARRSV